MKIFSITEEQLDSLDSEYMTRDAISVIVREIKTADNEQVINEKVKDDMKHLLQAMNKMGFGKGNRCYIYESNGGNCHGECPFAPTATVCELRKTISKYKHLLEE